METFPCATKNQTQAEDRNRFWKRIWGLGLPPKLALFLWKVVLRILPVRVVLYRREMALTISCPMCGNSNETIEHLFLECEMTRTIWRGSKLGLNFSSGSPVGFEEWFKRWLDEAPDKSTILETISITWAIYLVYEE